MAFGDFSPSRSSPINDINIVPLVDVLLVLLVVLIVTTPLLLHGVKVDLPKTSATAMKQKVAPLTLTIQSDGSLMLDNAAVHPNQLVNVLEVKSKQSPDVQLVINADKAVVYDHVAQAMAMAVKAGISKIGFVNDPDNR